jgi:molybdopterin/thiamine biosynthesis adenylyltransferase
MALNESQIRRYSRHVLLPDVGGTGQARLLAATVSIDLADDLPAAVAAATYLAAAGIGTLVLTHSDRPVTLSDLDGIALGEPDLGRPLLAALRDRLSALNPDVQITDVPAGGATHLVGGAPHLVGGAPYLVAEALVRGGAAAAALIHEIARGA